MDCPITTVPIATIPRTTELFPSFAKRKQQHYQHQLHPILEDCATATTRSIAISGSHTPFSLKGLLFRQEAGSSGSNNLGFDDQDGWRASMNPHGDNNMNGGRGGSDQQQQQNRRGLFNNSAVDPSLASFWNPPPLVRPNQPVPSASNSSGTIGNNNNEEEHLMAALFQQEEEEERLGTWTLPNLQQQQQQQQQQGRGLMNPNLTISAPSGNQDSSDSVSPLCQIKGCDPSRLVHGQQIPAAAALLEDSETMSLFVAAGATTRKRRRDGFVGGNPLEMPPPLPQQLQSSPSAAPSGASGLGRPMAAAAAAAASGFESPAFDENASSSSSSVSFDSMDGDEGDNTKPFATTSDESERPAKQQRRSSSLRVQQQQDDKWNKHFQQLCEFRKSFGHANVPHNYSANPVLARWVKRQRHQYRLQKEGRLPASSPSGSTSSALAPLPDSRIKALEEIGFVWDVYGDVWKERVAELLEYKRKTGSTDVPCRYQENQQLAIWVKCQRRQYKLFMEGRRSSITADRIKELDEIGFLWARRNYKNRGPKPKGTTKK